MPTHALFNNAVDIADKTHLEIALASGGKLRVKFGIDPTAPDLHLGHAVVLRKLRAFQDAGHQAVLIIGDFTAMIGDPTGKDATRPILTKEQVEKNLQSYLAQAGKILDIEKIEIRRNSEWLSDSLPILIELMNKVSIQQVLHRADFKKRLQEDGDISMLEIIYPILQGYDSVAIRADLEIGGADQLFNLLMGRRVQRAFNVPEQDILTTPLIEGTDGEQKMSKSLGNYITIAEIPSEMFGKLMSVPDELMPKYFALLTDIAMPTDMKPRDAKALLARTITAWLHSAAAADEAEREFTNVHGKKEIPQDMPEIAIGNTSDIVEILIAAGTKSKAEARRLIEQGGIKIDGTTVVQTEAPFTVKDGAVLQIGKLKFFKIKK